MNRTKPNTRAIEGKGEKVSPKIPADPKKDGAPTDKKDQEVLERLRKRFERSVAGSSDNRKAAVEDRKFKAGIQWPADVAAQRATDKRPCLTVNRMQTFVHQVTNPARENRPQINISPIGDRSDKEGAKIFEGMIRSIERDSHADIAYDTALDDAVTSGFGYIRLLTEWKSENSFEQVLSIRRVRNPFTVYLDPNSQEPDGSDAKFGFITELLSEDEFKREFPRAQVLPFDLAGIGEKYKSWITKDGIRIAEYYEVEEEPAELVELSNGWTGYRDEVDEFTERKIKNESVTIVDSRDSCRRKVMWYKVNAIQILERTEWVGKWVPIIPVIGEEIDIEGKVQYNGIIRNAKDSQRQYNYWVTSETELVALAPKAPYIIEEGQIEGHEQEWKNANRRPMPVLTYKATSLDGHMAPPPQRAPMVQIPAGVVQAKQGAAQDMMSTTGIRFDATVAERMSDESGKAIRELSRNTDVGAFHYYDNLRRSLEFLGRQMVDVIPKVYNRRQVTTILRKDDTQQNVTIDPSMGRAYREGKEGADQKLMRYFNPQFGEYGVTVDIGPSYATKRIEASESMMQFVRAMPNTAQLVMDLIASEMDWPGADKIAARLAKAIPPQMLTPEMKDVPPQVQALIQAQEQQAKQLQQQLQQVMKALNDKSEDRDIIRERDLQNYEAKMLAALIKSEDSARKVAAEQARATADILLEDMRAQRDHHHTLQEMDKQHGHELEKTEIAADAAKDDKDDGGE